MNNILRLRVELNVKNLEANFPTNFWITINKSPATKISDVINKILKVIKCTESELDLYYQDYFLPNDETALILADEALIVAKECTSKKQLPQNHSSNGLEHTSPDLTEPSPYKRKKRKSLKPVETTVIPDEPSPYQNGTTDLSNDFASENHKKGKRKGSYSDSREPKRKQCHTDEMQIDLTPSQNGKERKHKKRHTEEIPVEYTPSKDHIRIDSDVEMTEATNVELTPSRNNKERKLSKHRKSLPEIIPLNPSVNSEKEASVIEKKESKKDYVEDSIADSSSPKETNKDKPKEDSLVDNEKSKPGNPCVKEATQVLNSTDEESEDASLIASGSPAADNICEEKKSRRKRKRTRSHKKRNAKKSFVMGIGDLGAMLPIPAVTTVISSSPRPPVKTGGEENSIKNVKVAEVNVTESTECTEYDSLRPLQDTPMVGDVIAYKILELADNFCPEVSDYKEAEVLAYNPTTQELSLHIRKGAKKALSSPAINEEDGEVLETEVVVRRESLLLPKIISQTCVV